MDALCKLNKRCGCRDNRCARSLARLKKREVDAERGRFKLLRKDAQRAWPPGSCGMFCGRFFTVIGSGCTNGEWKVMVSFDGNIELWDLMAMRRLNHV